ncbi:MAG: Rft protein-domain-containing protein [Piptocephalis tieghemiana]|nr:MAG: Rft protein-domain-containing protein [Piptocephalis tieghemiana]
MATVSTNRIVEKSWKGARLLLFLQAISKLLTFTLNQVLYRLTSPTILGLAYVQYDLILTTLLFLSREGLRCACLRQPLLPLPPVTQGDQRRTRILVNTSYLPFLAVLVGTIFYAGLRLVQVDRGWLSGPGEDTTLPLALYVLSVLIELASEPGYALIQANMNFSTRVEAEGAALAIRTLLTLLGTLSSSPTIHLIPYTPWMHGVLPFAWAQVGYALTLYLYYLVDALRKGYLSYLWPKGPSSLIKGEKGKRSTKERWVDQERLSLTWTFTRQSILKHFLTEGDRLVISTVSSTTDQGLYAFVGNYGSLLARLVFQPLEETSKALFARLFSTEGPSGPSEGKGKVDSGSIDPSTKENTSSQTLAAQTLALFIHLHLLLGLFLIFLAPAYTHLLIRLLGGEKWVLSGAPSLLALYCAYIPFMGVNGVLEAFFQAVASPSELKRYNGAMVGFSILYGLAGLGCIQGLGMGAYGLVLANMLSMSCRIYYCLSYSQSFLSQEKSDTLRTIHLLPHRVLVCASILGSGVLLASWKYLYLQGHATTYQMVGHVGIGGLVGLILLLIL